MKYFLFYHNGSLNRGCEAIVKGSVEIIKKYDKNASFVLSSFRPETDSFENIDVVEFKTVKLSIFEHAVSYLKLKTSGDDTYAYKKMYAPVVKQAAECDVCLSIGGDTYCYGDNKCMQVLTRELKKSGKKVFLWGASVGESDLDSEKLKSLSDFDAIFTRESTTYNVLKEKKANRNIALFADPAFCMNPAEVSETGKREKVGVNVSPLVEKINPELLNYTDGFISDIINNTDYDVVLVPHVTEDRNNDFEMMRPLYDRYSETGRVSILPPDLKAAEYKGYISGLKYFIGARTHATIAAYSSFVPTLVLGYSVKSTGIANDLFGSENYVIDVKDISSAEDIISAFENLRENESEIRKKLREEIPAKKALAQQMGAELVKFASKTENLQ